MVADSKHHLSYSQPKVLGHKLKTITARNPSPFTFIGTNTYILGTSTLAIIDPGPNLKSHFNNLRKVIGEKKVSHIILTHAHKDHSELSMSLAQNYNANIFIYGLENDSEFGLFKKVSNSGSESDFKKYLKSRCKIVPLYDGNTLCGDDWTLEVLHTPGHSHDHVCLSWLEEKVLFSGDHVMGWSSTMIAPPSGNMSDFMSSLRRLLSRPEHTYYPGHGNPIQKAQDVVLTQYNHRKNREKQILELIPEGGINADKLIDKVYKNLNPELHNAAALTLLAHLIDLRNKQKVFSDKTIERKTLVFRDRKTAS